MNRIKWFAVFLIGACSPLLADPARFYWVADLAEFGGISAIEVSDDGNSFVALGDRCLMLSGTIARQDGLIAGMQITQSAVLRDTTGSQIAARHCDSEGLAISPRGAFVSFEGPDAAVWQYDGPFGAATALPAAAEFARMAQNGALEALAIDTSGALFTLAEDQGHGPTMPLFRFADGTWSVAAHLPHRPPYKPVGADFGPDGRFYLLERHANVMGVRSRIRSFDASFDDERVDFESKAGQFSNLEGISLWTNAQGQLTATMVSDNNLMVLLTTEIVEVLVGN